ncbi:hypothetical protein ACN47E_007231 [Coniothyrium glycines]
MIYITAILSLFLGDAIASPTISVDPVRTLPPNWQYTITSLHGSGCPANPDPLYTTRTTYGQNTVDGSEIYYWFVAYPAMRVSLSDGGTAHTWRETELSYREFADNNGEVTAEEYRLRLHKNGTRFSAVYELEEGVTARWEVRYDAGKGKEIVDRLIVPGPFSSVKYATEKSSPAQTKTELAPLPECGRGTIKFRTDLYVEGTKGKRGSVASELYTNEKGVSGYYGAQQGFSYDFEKCGK